jgi:Zn-dependent M28 family amino/carboxypeptidase
MNWFRLPRHVAVIVGVSALGFTLLHAGDPPRALRSALETITAEDLLRHTTTLASDEFEGRAPGTPGEDRTVAYLGAEFARIGLEPGNPDGTWVQQVPMVGLTALDPRFEYRGGGPSVVPELPTEAVIWTKRFVPEVRLDDTEVVFVGYGVVAPEYGWDDYKGVDVRGKTILMLINDPAVPDPGDPARLNPRFFQGRAMTYYGRWTYKYEIAAEKGAAAAIIVHEDGPAGYPWSVVAESNSQEEFDLAREDGNRGRTAIEGWVTLAQGRKLCAAGGFDYEALKRQAAGKDFRPVPLGVKASFFLRNQQREVRSRNVVARLPGSDPRHRDEYVVLTAHWDHLGRDPKLAGDQIYNGAFDNATGVAAILEVAEAAARLKRRPGRTLLFLSVTAEEKGLLGAAYYAAHPLYPLDCTVANLNVDGMNPWGRTRDVEVIGFGQSTLDEVMAAAAATQGRVVKPDSEPEKGRFYRSDHFEFAKQGVPALYFKAGVDFIGRPPGYGEDRAGEYLRQDYHRVSDEVKPRWDLAGAVEDTRLLFQCTWAAAQAKTWPVWKPGSEFKARRDEQLRKPGKP